MFYRLTTLNLDQGMCLHGQCLVCWNGHLEAPFLETGQKHLSLCRSAGLHLILQLASVRSSAHKVPMISDLACPLSCGPLAGLSCVNPWFGEHQRLKDILGKLYIGCCGSLPDPSSSL